jgi:toxin ParE1/3/4
VGQARAVRVRYTLPALADLASILDYVAVRSPQGARRVQARIKAVIELLLVHPYIGVRTEDSTIRRLTTTPYPYLVFYEVTEFYRGPWRRKNGIENIFMKKVHNFLFFVAQLRLHFSASI